MLNELMQSNIDCVMDDRDDFPDSWVELYNGGTTSARLNRYSIGITPQPVDAWPLPAREVLAGERVLIYCDKVGDGIHTNFRLESSKGCQVYLFRDGQLIDHLEGLKKQPAPNCAYGRQTDGDDSWGYQLQPTPGEANGGGICDHEHVLPAPLFSQEGMVTTTQTPVILTLTVPDGLPAETEIHYTIDGCEPTRQSPLYRMPLHVTGSAVVRARLFCQGWLSPPSVAHSYIFFPRRLTLSVVSISTDQRYLNDDDIGIFANNDGNHRHDWRRPVNIEFFFGQDTAAVVNQLCETRVSGGASRGAPKKSMAIYAHKRFGQKRFSYEFFPDQCPGVTDYKSLVLRNAGNDFDYLYMRDAIAQLSMGTHVDLDFQAWRPAIVYINGRYHGMLNIRERANENNVYTHYDGLEDIDLIENWYDLKEGTWDAFRQFQAFYAEHGHTMAEYEQWMDCHEFINLMAMNLYFNNVDFPANNIVMWRPRTTASGQEGQGRWRWIAKDCDYIMGIYNQGAADYQILEWLYNTNYDSILNWGNKSGATRLFRRLMEDEDFSRAFTDRCAVYMGTFLSEQGIRTLWDAMYETISYEYPYHRQLVNRWWPNYADELQQARSWLSQRTEHFYQQLSARYNLGTPIPLTVNQPEEAPLVAITFNDIPLEQAAFRGRYYQGSTLTLQATSGGGRQVTGWRVQTITGATSVSSEVSGPLLTMTMPSCTSMNITPLVADDTSIALLPAPQPFSWQRTADGYLFLSGVAPGTVVSLYDLQGMLLTRTTAPASGADVVLSVPHIPACILRVGSTVLKIACQ